MNAIPSEKIELETAEQNQDLDAVTEVEAGIREFVRNDVAYLRRPGQTSLGDLPENDTTVKNVNSLIQRVAGQSIGEIDHVIGELTRVRDMLRSEGERVQREISGYASLSQAAMTSMKIIGDSLVQWKSQSPLPVSRKD